MKIDVEDDESGLAEIVKGNDACFIEDLGAAAGTPFVGVGSRT